MKACRNISRLAEIRDDTIWLGGLSADRMQLLRTASLIPLKTFFTIDTTSSYYNESAKANVFYVQAWAFVHYLMHGEYASRFKSFLGTLATAAIREWKFQRDAAKIRIVLEFLP